MLTALLASARFELIAGHEVERQYVKPRIPAIYVLWHGRLLPCAYHYRKLRLGTLISRNRDGDHITRTIEGWGFTVVRGSSSRGGATALLELVRLLRAGTPVAVTPDGPRGPMQKMKMGPLHAARQSGAPIIPVSAGARSAWYFGRWDRFLVPRPFSRIRVALGSPYEVPRSSDDESMGALAERIEGELNRLTLLVDGKAEAPDAFRS
jgi:lysophospholipid acyltransferase (LPLAT)-like uncharacterized protein